jgi:hypothetical protein
MKATWKILQDENCDLCGDSAEIFNATNDPCIQGFDGDPVRCMGCGAEGYFVVTEDECYTEWIGG